MFLIGGAMLGQRLDVVQTLHQQWAAKLFVKYVCCEYATNNSIVNQNYANFARNNV